MGSFVIDFYQKRISQFPILNFVLKNKFPSRARSNWLYPFFIKNGFANFQSPISILKLQNLNYSLK